jgi:hypothetical protein
MIRALTIIAAMAVAGFGAPAQAFQEQGGRAAGSSGPSSNVVTPASPMPKTGTEIRLPGLGQIGLLPKFDFGLELLYGASEPKGIREELNKSEQNDLQVRGILKFKLPN